MSKILNKIEHILLFSLFCLSFLIGRAISNHGDNFGYAICLFLLFILFGLVYIVIAKQNGLVLFNRKMAIVLCFLVLFYLVTILIPVDFDFSLISYRGYVMVMKSDASNNITSIVFFLIVVITIYLCSISFVNLDKYKNDIKIFSICFFLFALGLISISLIKERSIYLAYFMGGTAVKEPVVSITSNRNIFAGYLLTALIISTLYCKEKSHWYTTLLNLIFFTFILFSQSVTCILLGAVILVYNFIMLLVRCFQHRKQRAIICAQFWILISLVLCSISLLILAIFVDSIPFISKLMGSLIFALKNRDLTTLTERIVIFSKSFEALTASPVKFIFGFGFNKAYFVDFISGDVEGCHNAYLQMWFDGGLALLCLYIFIIGGVIVSIVKLFKHRKISFAIRYIILILIILSHSIVEAYFKFGLSIFSLVFIILIIPELISEIKVSNNNAQLLNN